MIGTFSTFGGAAVCAVLLFVVLQYVAAIRRGQAPKFPISIDPSKADDVLAAAFAGNPALMLKAIADSFHLEVGSTPARVALALAMRDVERRVKDPALPTPIIAAIAFQTGLTEQQVFDILKAKLSPSPVATPVPSPVSAPVIPIATPLATVVALALCLCLAGSASASYPSHINADLRAPQEFIPADNTPIIAPPRMWNQRGELVEYQEPVGYRIGACVTDEWGNPTCPTAWAQPVYYQHSNQVGWWQSGPTRRFVSAPVRWFASRRPIRRALGFIFRRRC